LFGFVGALLGNVSCDVRESARVMSGTVLKLRLLNLPFLYSDTRKQHRPRPGQRAVLCGRHGIRRLLDAVHCHLPGDILTLSATNDLDARIALLFAYVLGLAILARRRPGRLHCSVGFRGATGSSSRSAACF